MISKHLYFKIILWVLSIVAVAIASGVHIVFSESYHLLFFTLPLIVILTITLIRFLNKTNRRMAYFFSAIRNDDTNIQLPKDIVCKSVDELYDSLSFLNDKLKQTKIDISYNEQLLKALIENSSAGFMTIDENGTFEILNSTARHYMDVEYTTNFTKLKEVDPSLFQTLKNIVPGKKYTHRVHRPQGELVLSISSTLIKYYTKEYTIVILQDITRELDDQELEAWHKLFRVITHEIMNSIAPITSLTEKLNSYYKIDGETISPAQVDQKMIDKTLTGLGIIDDMSQGLIHFVENYRQLNKIPQPKLADIDLKIWLAKLKALMLESSEELKPAINIQYDPQMKSFKGDEKLLNQVIINLYLNALDAMRAVDNPQIEMTLERNEEGKVLLRFKDNGAGIAPEHMERVLIPFFTTKDEGNGIGLSLSKQIIQKHGGSLNFHSEQGKGTSVNIVL